MNDNWKERLQYLFSSDVRASFIKISLVFAALMLIQYGLYKKYYTKNRESALQNKSFDLRTALLEEATRKGDFTKMDAYHRKQTEVTEEMLSTLGYRRAPANDQCAAQIQDLQKRVDRLERQLQAISSSR